MGGDLEDRDRLGVLQGSLDDSSRLGGDKLFRGKSCSWLGL